MLETKNLDALLDQLVAAPVYSEQQLKDLWEKDKVRRRAAIERMFDEGVSYGVATGTPAFLNQPEDQFFAYLKKIDNELDEQVKIVGEAFTDYLKTGEHPAPYYAWRIAIILRKAKMKEKEKEFLTAWCRHFAKTKGNRYEAIAARAAKMGITVALTILCLGIATLPSSSEAKSFHGENCTQDCSGHKAGYEWARKKHITTKEQCGGKSNSFVEGCRSWVEENQTPSDDHSTDK